MIPMRQTVKITKSAGLDAWGESVAGQVILHKCRIDNSSAVVVSRDGREVASKATILIKGVADVGYDDRLEWADELGQHVEAPIAIAVLRDLGSRPLFTKVVV